MEEITHAILSILGRMGAEIEVAQSTDGIETYECRIVSTQAYDGWSLTKRLHFNVKFNHELREVRVFTSWLDNLTNGHSTFQKILSYNVFMGLSDKSLPIRMVIEELYKARYNTKDSFFAKLN